MTFVAEEIAGQPGCWEQAAALAGTTEVSAVLPAAGERVAVVGCGTSLFMAQAFAALREDAGLGETDAFPASRFPARRRYDRVVALTRSGTTTEVVRVLAGLAPDRPSVALTTARDLPAARHAGASVDLGFADERSVVQTRFATTALALWRAHLGHDLSSAIADARRLLGEPVAGDLVRCSQFTFLGSGWTAGLANEAALKCREAAQAWTESYPAMEYRHGPISIAAPGTAVWVFGTPPPGLLDEVAATGARVVAEPGTDPMAHLVAAQRLAVALAAARGLDPDSPRNLTRSIVLTPDGETT